MARRMSLPYLDIAAQWDESGAITSRRAELTRAGVGHSQLLIGKYMGPLRCIASDINSIKVEATYVIEGLPGGAKVWVEQRYRFDRMDLSMPQNTRPNLKRDNCEASGDLPCHRFWPEVRWGLEDPNRLGLVRGVRLIQRFEFDPDAIDGATGISRGNIVRDRAAGGGLFSGFQSVQTLGDGFMKRESSAWAIVNGQRKQDTTWDSWHQTARGDGVAKPGANPRDPHPGCSECVHAHWSWGGGLVSFERGLLVETELFDLRLPAVITRNITSATNGFSDGKPELLDGSGQNARLAAVRYSADNDEIDPWRSGYEALINPDGGDLGSDRPVLYWDSSMDLSAVPPDGIDVAGRHFAIGDAVWPQLLDKRHGGNGSMFFAPARVLARTDIASVAGLPFRIVVHFDKPSFSISVDRPVKRADGWLTNVTIDPCQGMNVGPPQGPFWLAISTAPGQVVLNPAARQVGPLTYLPVFRNPLDSLQPFGGGPILESLACEPGTVNFTVKVLFATEPKQENVPMVALLSAPDGAQQYTAYTEAATPPSPQATPPPTATNTPRNSAMRVYRDPQGHFSLTIPETWTVAQALPDVVVFQSPDPAIRRPIVGGTTTAEVLAVALERLPAGLTLEQYVQLATQNAQQLLPSYRPTLVNATPVTIDGKPAFRQILLAVSDTGVRLQLQQVFFLDRDYGYILSFIVPQEVFALYSAVFDQVANTFTVGMR
jgi:hypothetical protein